MYCWIFILTIRASFEIETFWIKCHFYHLNEKIRNIRILIYIDR